MRIQKQYRYFINYSINFFPLESLQFWIHKKMLFLSRFLSFNFYSIPFFFLPSLFATNFLFHFLYLLLLSNQLSICTSNLSATPDNKVLRSLFWYFKNYYFLWQITPVKHSRLQKSARARKVADAEPSTHRIIL